MVVKKLMPESLLNNRFRSTTLLFEELLIALENISIDKVTTYLASKVKKMETSAPLEIGVAVGTDGEEAFEGGYGTASELAVQAVYKGTGAKCGWSGSKDPSWSVQKYFNSGNGEKEANRAGKGQWSKTGGKNGGKGQEKGCKGETRVCWSCGKTGHIAANCTKGSWNKSLNAVEEDKGDISEEVHEDDDELHAWCLLEESESEQWQEVTSKKSELKKKLDYELLLSVENNSGVLPREVIEVKDNWVNIRATRDTGAAGDVMSAEMFPRVTLDRTSTTKEVLCSKWRKDQTPVRRPYHSSPWKECTGA